MFKSFWLLGAVGTLFFGAFSQSNGYKLQNYGVGSGGTNSSTSTSYKLNASSGEVNGGTGSGGTTKDLSGSIQAGQANVPLAPTVSNGSSTYYNKLQVTINTSGSDASDYSYSIAVSTNGFSTVNYVQADGTLGITAVYQTYTAWGGSSGTAVIGLTPITTYQVKVDAKQGTFSASAYGPIGSGATVNPSLLFSVTPSTVNLGTLNAGSVITGGSNISFTFSTNGTSGGSVYVAGANNGLKSTAANNTIAATNGDLAAVNEGFGVQGLSASQTSGGPFAINSPFNGSSNTVGAASTTFKQLFSSTVPLVGGTSSAALKGKAASTTPAGGDYSETLTFVASAGF